MAYNISKLIADVKQVFVNQARQLGAIPQVTAPQEQSINILSNGLAAAINDYVRNGGFSVDTIQSVNLASSAVTAWLYTPDSVAWTITRNYQTTPGVSGTIIPAANYMRTISVTSGGSGNLDTKIFMNTGISGWVLVSRGQMYNTAFAIIPANSTAAVSMQNTGGAETQVSITVLRAS